MYFIYKEYVSLFSTVKKWAAVFKCGRTFLEDYPRKGRAKTATTDESFKKIHDKLVDDRLLKIYEIAKAVYFAEEKVRYI